jgi:hypothetical protein
MLHVRFAFKDVNTAAVRAQQALLLTHASALATDSVIPVIKHFPSNTQQLGAP